MRNRLLAMMGLIVTVMALIGVRGHLFAKPVEQEDSEDTTILGTAFDASVVNGRISYQLDF